MQDQPTSTGASSRYDLLAGRFRLLAIDPTATSAQVEQAYAIARARAVAPNQTLAEARDSIVDPAQRLLCELAYPLDSTTEQVNAFYADLSGNAPVSELLQAANNLPPLSRANFLAHLGARHAAEADLLSALVGAHAAIDAAAIYEILRECRSRAGFPMPSLVGIRQGLQELLTLHSESAVAAFDTIQCAAAPLLECVRQILSSDDRYRLEALSGLLDAYRRSPTGLNLSANHDIDAACEAIEQRPDDTSSFGKFEKALVGWISTVAPLALFDAHQKLCNDGVDRIVARARVLLADLIARGDHEAARKTVTVCLDAFSLLPGFVDPFEEAAMALQELLLEAKIKPLEELIQDFSREPALLIAAIQKRGFGKGSSGQAYVLWEAFSAAVTATHPTELNERPWASIRDFASNLHARPELAGAATRLISDLLRFGETLPASPAVLDILRDDLSKLEIRNGPATTIRKRSYIRTASFIAVVPVVMFSAFLAYRHLNLPLSPFRDAAALAVPKEEPEVIPPASKGEHFKQDFVRYCHFQEERLRVIKQHVQGREDIQAYNMLANDYNSRCSNFYYLDEDLKIVTEEVKAKKQILDADAMRILATWPWHAATGSASTPAVK
ncbi:hypothetical protein SAMN05443247_05702 [Bradyrhizobium erythrophlei]|nr:hypothetical protein SAMN05443247_05702 [Bradyrhizobium erythrophlei]